MNNQKFTSGKDGTGPVPTGVFAGVEARANGDDCGVGGGECIGGASGGGGGFPVLDGAGGGEVPCAQSADANGEALQLIVEALSHMQDAMHAMELKTEQIDETLRGVAQRIERLEGKVPILELRPLSPNMSPQKEKMDVGENDTLGELLTTVQNLERTVHRTLDHSYPSVASPDSGPEEKSSHTSCSVSPVSCPAAPFTATIPMTVHSSSSIQLPPILDGASSSSGRTSSQTSASIAPFSLNKSPSSVQPFMDLTLSTTSTKLREMQPASHDRQTLAAEFQSYLETGFSRQNKMTLGRKLLRAAEEGRVEEARKLLEEGADVDVRAADRWTPLHRAVRKSHAEMVALLLQKGANVHAKSSCGYVPLHLAAYHDRSSACTALLIEAGSDIDRKNQSGRTPLHSASECGNVEAVRTLLAAGANKRIKDKEGKTALDVAKTGNIRRLIRL